VKLLVENSNYQSDFTFGPVRHIKVIPSHVLFSPLKQTKYHSSDPGIERLISL